MDSHAHDPGAQHAGVIKYATSRPRVIGWLKSAAILDGDWGTSIAYVLGIAFTLAGYSSMWHLMMMLGLTTLVAFNYVTICRLNPNGGGVYSSVYHRSRSIAVVGALLLTADYVVTMALSVLDACHYIGLPHPAMWAIAIILFVGALNWFGPRHTGGLAFIISILTIATVLTIVVASAPAATIHAHIAEPTGGLWKNWSIFVGIILAISGIEAVSNMTGLMHEPTRDSRRAIFVVLGKVILLTVFLGLAMHAVPGLTNHTEDMIRFLGEHYVGRWFGWFVAFTLGLLLISAGNTALNDLINIQFLMSVDHELPQSLRLLNKHGVPMIPLVISTLIPVAVLFLVHDVLTLAELYAIGVVGAIFINIASTATDRTLSLARRTRTFMLISAVVLFFVECTIAVQKPKATLFASIILVAGLTARSVAHRRLMPAPSLAVPGAAPARRRRRVRRAPSYKYLVAVKDPSGRLLRFSVDEAKSRNAMLFVLRVKEISLGSLPASLELDTNGELDRITRLCEEGGIDYQILSIPSNEVGYTIAEQAATLGVDRVILGAPQRTVLEKVLKGNVVRSVSGILPDEIQLVIFGG